MARDPVATDRGGPAQHGKPGLGVGSWATAQEAERKVIHRMIYQELCHGCVTPASREALGALIESLRGEGAEGVIEVEEQQLVVDALVGGLAGFGQRLERVLEELLVAQVGDELAFRGCGVAGRGGFQNLLAQFRHPVAGERGGADSQRSGA